MDSLCLRIGLHGFNLNPLNSMNSNLESRPNPSMFSSGPLTGRTMSVGVIAAEKGDGGVKTTSSRFTFKHPFRSLLGSKGLAVDDVVLIDDKASKQVNDEELDRRENSSSHSASSSGCGDEKEGLCDCEYDDDENHIGFDRISFSKLLQRVSLTDARLFAQMSFLGNLAYSIPNIKPKYLLKRYGLRYVTSSIEKREQLASADKKEQLASSDSQQPTNESQETGPKKAMNSGDDKNKKFRLGPLAAFQMAASVASFLNAHTRQIFGSRKGGIDQEILEEGKCDKEHISEMASSFMSNTDSVTAVVAAKEEVKQAVADDLNSVSSTPCEWYICDDDKNATRFFFIQGSETLASWQANLLFEPIQFEGLDTVVHRGIYEAAKGIYQQMLPEIHAHMKAHGKRARLRFTGHSLGGSLSLLINLMLLIRGEVLRSSLLPVITFGSPTIMCGGDQLLSELDLPRSHIQAVTMHRDIVPRAFSCNYPNRVAKLLKAVNKNFRNHACLNNQKILYAPMGELLILQPDSSYSPQHDLLPTGRGLYILTSSHSDSKKAEETLRAAKLRFLNTPHPLEILKDRSAYGKGGAIQRDHDMNSYVNCIRSVIRHELSQLRKAERERRQHSWWAHVMPRDIRVDGYVVNQQGRFDISGILRTGSESLRRFSRIVTSKNLHLFVLLILPARLLLIGAFGFIGGFRLR